MDSDITAPCFSVQVFIRAADLPSCFSQICIKGKVHIFKYLNIEASKSTPDLPDYERRPLPFTSWCGLIPTQPDMLPLSLCVNLRSLTFVFVFPVLMSCTPDVVTGRWTQVLIVWTVETRGGRGMRSVTPVYGVY